MPPRQKVPQHRVANRQPLGIGESPADTLNAQPVSFDPGGKTPMEDRQILRTEAVFAQQLPHVDPFTAPQPNDYQLIQGEGS